MSGRAGIGALAGAGVGFMIGGPLGAVALGSAGMSAGAGMDAAKEAEELAKRNRNLTNEQALEVIRQSKLAAKNILKEGREMTGTQASAYAAGGVDVGSASALLAMEHTASQYKRDAYETVRAANWNTDAMRRKAQAEVDAAKAGRRAAIIGGIAQVGFAAVQTGMMAPKGSSHVAPGGGGGPAGSSGMSGRTVGRRMTPGMG